MQYQDKLVSLSTSSEAEKCAKLFFIFFLNMKGYKSEISEQHAIYLIEKPYYHPAQ